MKDIRAQRPTIRNQIQSKASKATQGADDRRTRFGGGDAKANAARRPAMTMQAGMPPRPMLGGQSRSLPHRAERPAPTNTAAWQAAGSRGPIKADNAPKMAVQHGSLPRQTTGGTLPKAKAVVKRV